MLGLVVVCAKLLKKKEIVQSKLKCFVRLNNIRVNVLDCKPEKMSSSLILVFLGGF